MVATSTPFPLVKRRHLWYISFFSVCSIVFIFVFEFLFFFFVSFMESLPNFVGKTSFPEDFESGLLMQNVFTHLDHILFISLKHAMPCFWAGWRVGLMQQRAYWQCMFLWLHSTYFIHLWRCFHFVADGVTYEIQLELSLSPTSLISSLRYSLSKVVTP